MGRPCSTYGETWVNLNERDYLENLSLDGRTILKWIFKKHDGGFDRIDLAQDRDRWWGFVNAVVKLRFP